MLPFFSNVDINYVLLNWKGKIQIKKKFKGNFNFTLLGRYRTLWKGGEEFKFEH